MFNSLALTGGIQINKEAFMKTYLKVVALVLLTIINLGVVLPFLLSAKSDELFALGVIDIIAILPIYFYSLKSLFKRA